MKRQLALFAALLVAGFCSLLGVRVSRVAPGARIVPVFHSVASVNPLQSAGGSAAQSEGGLRVQPTAQPMEQPKAQVTKQDRQLLSVLNQILTSKNDNDPRLDTDFRDLSPGAKELFVRKYERLPQEARDERGTIVFLIGRDLTRPQDFDFLARVANEPPCLSLGDCRKRGPYGPYDDHEEPAISVTLAYPQYVAVQSVENFLIQASLGQKDPALVKRALETLSQMAHSPVLPIAHKAAALKRRFAGLSRYGN